MSRLRPGTHQGEWLARPSSPEARRRRRRGPRESRALAPKLSPASPPPRLARCEAASCDRDVVKGSSRMKGNFHVRFLGEAAAVMPASLPDHKFQRKRRDAGGPC